MNLIIYYTLYIVKYIYKIFFIFIFLYICATIYIQERCDLMRINIKDIMDDKKITRYELAKNIGVTYPTMTNIYNGESTSIKFDILEKICLQLDCTPNDILISDYFSTRIRY